MLGLDLQGGISIVLYPVAGSDLSALNTAAGVIRNRVDGLGIAEPDVQRQGDTIVVNLPGVKDREKAENLVGETAELRFREVLAQYPGRRRRDTTTEKGATTTSGGKGSTTTGNGSISPGSTTTVAPTTSGKAEGVTITTDPIVAHRRHDPRELPRHTSTTPTSAGGVTPTTIPPSTTTSTPPPFPGCEQLIKESPPNTDTAQVVLPDRARESCFALGPAGEAAALAVQRPVQFVEHRIGQGGRQGAALRHPLGRRLALAVDLRPAFEKAVDELEHIGCIHVLAHANHESVVVDAIEERLQIDVHHPAVSLSDRGLGVAHRLVCVAPGPEAVAVRVEVRLPVSLHHLRDALLDEPVHHGGDAQKSFSSVWLWDFYTPDWLGAVAALDQLRADARPVRSQVGTD